MHDPLGDELLTAQDLARVLKVPVSRVRRWTSERRLPFVKLGHRTTRYSRRAVLAWIASKTVEPLGRPGEDLDDGVQTQQDMARRLSVSVPRDRPTKTIPPHDCSSREEG